MSNTQTATCQDCGWTGPVEETNEFRNVLDRVLPGHVMPAGECPEEGCGGAAMLDSTIDSADRLRTALETLALELDRIHRAIYAGRLRAPIGNYLATLAKNARKALAAGPLMQPVCNKCGGTDVRIDAWAAWHLDTQRWELHSTYDSHAICDHCGAECTYTMEPAGERT